MCQMTGHIISFAQYWLLYISIISTYFPLLTVLYVKSGENAHLDVCRCTSIQICFDVCLRSCIVCTNASLRAYVYVRMYIIVRAFDEKRAPQQ